MTPSDLHDDVKQIFAFVHIEKCGGQTFGRMLRRSYGLQHQDLISLRRHTDVADELDVAHLLRIFPDCRSIMGHNVRPYCDFGRFTSRMTYYTLLRDPVDRYLSDYAMHVRGGFQGSFSQWSAFDVQHNLMVQAFSPRGDIEEAKDIFSARISFYDTLNDFDRFVGRAQAALPGQRLSTAYRLVNDAPSGHGPPDLQRPEDVHSAREKAAALNALDVAFYKWASDRLAVLDIPAPRPSGCQVATERGLGGAVNFYANLLMRNLVYKPSCGLHPGEVDSISKYRAPWPKEGPSAVSGKKPGPRSAA